jgi:beta-phosphoglucomutase-like phosphatase (HAD superfamily)
MKQHRDLDGLLVDFENYLTALLQAEQDASKLLELENEIKV